MGCLFVRNLIDMKAIDRVKSKNHRIVQLEGIYNDYLVQLPTKSN